MDYGAFFESALTRLREDRRYRVFVDLEQVTEPDLRLHALAGVVVS
jgi:hypothetical protein